MYSSVLIKYQYSYIRNAELQMVGVNLPLQLFPALFQRGGVLLKARRQAKQFKVGGLQVHEKLDKQGLTKDNGPDAGRCQKKEA